jgi:hypothetical protein
MKKCEWCGEPVSPEICVQVRDWLFHWECFVEAGEALKKSRAQSGENKPEPPLDLV